MVIMRQVTRGIRGRFIVCEEIREEGCPTQAEEDVSANMLDPASASTTGKGFTGRADAQYCKGQGYVLRFSRQARKEDGEGLKVRKDLYSVQRVNCMPVKIESEATGLTFRPFMNEVQLGKLITGIEMEGKLICNVRSSKGSSKKEY